MIHTVAAVAQTCAATIDGALAARIPAEGQLTLRVARDGGAALVQWIANEIGGQAVLLRGTDARWCVAHVERGSLDERELGRFVGLGSARRLYHALQSGTSWPSQAH